MGHRRRPRSGQAPWLHGAVRRIGAVGQGPDGRADQPGLCDPAGTGAVPSIRSRAAQWRGVF